MFHANQLFNIASNIIKSEYVADHLRLRDRGDDALLNTSPEDERADEKVIVNEQKANKTINAPSQTSANTSEENSNDEEILDNKNEEEVKDKDE